MQHHITFVQMHVIVDLAMLVISFSLTHRFASNIVVDTTLFSMPYTYTTTSLCTQSMETTQQSVQIPSKKSVGRC